VVRYTTYCDFTRMASEPAHINYCDPLHKTKKNLDIPALEDEQKMAGST